MVALRIWRVIEAHLADRGVGPEAADPDQAPVVHLDDDADAAFEDEMHGAGSFALRGDDLVLVDFEPLAELRQLLGELGIAERLGEPVAQRAASPPPAECAAMTSFFASLKRAVEVASETITSSVMKPRDCERHCRARARD